MCPSCRAFITSNDRTCPYCGVQVGPRAIDRREPGEILGGLIPQAHFTTVLILVINFGYFILSLVLSGSMSQLSNGPLEALGVKYGPLIFQDHEYWRLVTAGFMHGGWLHILMNSWVLYDLGAQVEQVYGTPRFLVIYFVGSVGGFYLSAVVNPLTPSLGASAALMGLIGAMIAFGVANRSATGRAVRSHYGRWVVYIIAFGLIPGFNVDNWAHIGGLAAGFVVGYAAGTPGRSNAAQEGVWRVLAAVCLLLTALSFFEVYRNFPPANQLR
jgi:rhomboid protease GluP